MSGPAAGRIGGLRLLRIVVFVNLMGLVALAVMLAFAFSAIQGSRVSAAEFSCDQTNERHANTIDNYDRAIAKMPDGARKARALRNRDATVGLLNAIVPFRKDCHAYAVKVVSAK